jgi:hypothetical protein
MYLRCTLDVAGAPGSEHPARCFETRDRRSVLNIVRSREDGRHGADTADHGWGDRSAEGCRCRARSSPTCSCRNSSSPEQAFGVPSGADSICSSYFDLAGRVDPSRRSTPDEEEARSAGRNQEDVGRRHRAPSEQPFVGFYQCFFLRRGGPAQERSHRADG